MSHPTPAGEILSSRWCGISLKANHYQSVLESRPEVAFFEVHAENYMVDGGAHHHFLKEISSHYPLSVHGVGLSLGTADGIDLDHLERLAKLVETYQPFLVSEHLAWAADNGTYLNDLLPVPLTAESLAIIADNIQRVQDRLGRQILVENPSSYMAFTHSQIPEPDFLMELTEKTRCGLLLDLNNIVVSGSNLGIGSDHWLNTIDPALVHEIHLAGHDSREVDGVTIKIDDHGSRVSDEVLDLYESWLARAGSVPTLIEWDSNIPSLDILTQEALRAEKITSKITQQKGYAHA